MIYQLLGRERILRLGLRQRYVAHTRPDAMDRALICGRLGEYRYYDMDQAIGRATMLAEKLLARDLIMPRAEPLKLSA